MQRVSILVVMENALGELRRHFRRNKCKVSILVVMENALGDAICNGFTKNRIKSQSLL